MMGGGGLSGPGMMGYGMSMAYAGYRVAGPLGAVPGGVAALHGMSRVVDDATAGDTSTGARAARAMRDMIDHAMPGGALGRLAVEAATGAGSRGGGSFWGAALGAETAKKL